MAILSNTKDLEDAYVQSLNAEGSAYAENEKYLDSIQGKIDQFTNAVQTMWSNTLDDSVVKGFVSFGTIVVKVIDKIGLLNAALVALSAVTMIKNKMGPLEFLKGITELITNLNSKIVNLPNTINNLLKSSQQLTASTLEQAVANGSLTTSEAIRQATTNGLVLSQVSLTAEEAKALLANTALNESEKQNIITKLGLSSSSQKLTLAILQQAVATGKLTTSEATQMAIATGLIAKETALNAARATKILTTNGVSASEAQAIITALGLGKTTQTLTVATIQQAIANGTLTASQGAVAMFLLATQGAATGLIGTLGALLAAIWPLLAIGVGIFAIVKILDTVITTTEELEEELSGLKSELSDIQSELNSVNSELKTTQDRMAELLSLPSLSFVQQEELEKLKKTNSELQRRKKLLKNEEERTQKRVNEKAVETVESQLKETSYNGKWYDVVGNAVNRALQGAIAGATAGAFVGGVGAIPGAIVGGITGAVTGVGEELIGNRISTKDKLKEEIEGYNDLIKEKERIEKELETADDTKKKFLWWEFDSDVDNLKKDLKDIEKEITETEEYIDGTFNELGTNLQGIVYGDGYDELLDFYYEYKHKWENIYGSDGAKVDAIEFVFSKEEFANISESIDRYVEKLKNGDKSAASEIKNIISNNQQLVDALKNHGVELQDAIDYFVLEEGIFNSDTIEGITAQYAKALNTMNQLKDMGRNGIFTVDDIRYNWNEFFTKNDAGKFEANATKFSEILKGMDEDCRNTFMSLSEQVKNGALTWEQAIKSFSHSGTLAGLKVLEAQIVELNNTEFSNISDELSGVIDTFSEFSAALKEVAASMELLNTAQTQMNNAGRISVLTALEIIDSTDRWNEILSIENGNIRLVGNATEVLVEDKLALIKSNLQNALSTVTEQLAMVDATDASDDMAMTMEESTNQAVRKLAGSMAYLTTMTEAYTRAANGEKVNVSQYMAKATQAQKEAEEALNWKVNAANEIGKTELEKRKQEIEAQIEMLKGISTVEDFKNNYDFDKTPGDKYSDSGSTESALEKLKKKYENKIALLEAQQTYLENEISRLEASDQQVSRDLYDEQIKLEQQKLKLYEEEREKLLAQMSTVAKNSDEWYDYADAIWSVEHAIQETTISIVELQKKIAQLYIDVFNKIEEAYGREQSLHDKRIQYLKDEIELLKLRNEYATISPETYNQLSAEEDAKIQSNQNEITRLKALLKKGIDENGEALTEEDIADMLDTIYENEADIRQSEINKAKYEQEKKQAYLDRFNNTAEAYDNLANVYQDNYDNAEQYKKYADLYGISIPKEILDYQSNQLEQQVQVTLNKKAELERQLAEAIASGDIEVGDSQWLEMVNAINDCTSAANDFKYQIAEIEQEIKALSVDKFNDIKDAFNNVNDVFNDRQSYIEEYMNYLEALGIDVPAEMYEELIANEEDRQASNRASLESLRRQLAEMEANGYTAEDDEWVQAQADIRALEKEILASETAMAQWNKTIQEMSFEKFDEFLKRISDICDELENVYGLISDEDVALEDGSWTEEGIMSLGLMTQKMAIAKQQAEEYAKEIDKLNEEYKKGTMSEQDYYDRLMDLKNGQWESINSYKEAKDAIVDINEARIDQVENGIQKEISAFEELIDLKKKELESEKD